MYKGYLAKLTNAFVDDLAEAQENLYDLLASHNDHDLVVELDYAYNPTFALCFTCNKVLLDLDHEEPHDQDPEGTNPISAAARPDDSTCRRRHPLGP